MAKQATLSAAQSKVNDSTSKRRNREKEDSATPSMRVKDKKINTPIKSMALPNVSKVHKKTTTAASYRFIDLFAGIGGIRIGLERAGGTCVFSSEWDEQAAQSYERYFGEKPAGDITKISSEAIPDHDILAGGFPCQAFSIMGDKEGFNDTRGTLFFEIERILSVKKPRAILLENVRNLVSHDGGRTFKKILSHLGALGYHVHWRILNALDYDLPQKRERVIIVGFLANHPFVWPTARPLSIKLEDILEPDEAVDKKHFASEAVRQSVEQRLIGKKIPYGRWICHENKSGNISPLSYSCALRAGASYNYLLVEGLRRLTPRENLRLQGFPDDFPIAVPDSAIRKQCGNSVPVKMIEAVAKQIVTALKQKPIECNGLPLKLEEGQLAMVFEETT
jgi:DNA (cytosine-5)-methyltransferase 1